jgi:hypothetical protein
MIKIFGGVLIALGFLLLFTASNTRINPPDVSAVIGAYLPGLVLLIVGLALFGSKPRVPPQADPQGGVQPPSPEQIERERAASYLAQAQKGVIGGFVLMLLASSIGRQGGPYLLCSLPVVAGGWALFVWGCCGYMKWKGYSARYGLFGLLLLFGLAVLVFFPNKQEPYREDTI